MKCGMGIATNSVVCCICEREQGEDGCDLTQINTMECVVPICDTCMTVARTHAFIKCRVCGAVCTIPKGEVPGYLGQHTFIIFSEGCRFCHDGRPQ